MLLFVSCTLPVKFGKTELGVSTFRLEEFIKSLSMFLVSPILLLPDGLNHYLKNKWHSSVSAKILTLDLLRVRNFSERN